MSKKALNVLAPPSYWTPAADLDYSRVQLRSVTNKKSEEYRKCVDAFKATLPRARVHSLQVRRRAPAAPTPNGAA
jgi:hypothetical protein